MQDIIEVVLSQQFRLMDDLKKFGKPWEKASVKELTQLNDMTTFIPLAPNNLTREDRLKALLSLMFLVDE